ncbi:MULTISPECIES: flagellar export protein FliJ [Tenebrionibacter/Tenebrionicola group]|jgi:flagellar FliJ protein|uniref:Flagellar FliJ protein n=2 Tax=Tenebrionibacter/Tenebrionicola group TaxID=2969848 RepID=A0A8K0V4N9_9ENTR|nr:MULTISPECIES: flagellar export protein FliJ [Tenebrionibacter/Tenebrionicola group]MBK4716726.1 flagella biosynthesis chaperone FliJ [Tenebrionibacter intestinalis]MBV4414000.1 flagella biosynthesis chaperone FliJ [Tenebrionicola larvae]MBV5096213.1 flagella biosynthesis chaperone FliJ [Tenebrionicola larvae]
MATASPMDTLREIAEEALQDATTQLGKMRQACAQAEAQLNQLINYELEYRQQLHQNMTSQGMAATNWMNYQQFMTSLDRTLENHRQHVSQCQQRVNLALTNWQEKKQRLNAFETLRDRALAKQLHKENKLDQKMMDEYAQRASMRKETR